MSFLLLWTCLTMPVKNDGINLWKTLMFTSIQKIDFIPNFFLEISPRYCKRISLLRAWLAKSTCRKRWCLSVWKNQLHHVLFSWAIANIQPDPLFCFPLMAKRCAGNEISKILQNFCFEYFRHALPFPSDMIVSPCTKPWCLSAQNINFIPQRFCTVVILGALNMPGYGHLKQWNQLLENYDVHFHAKNQIYPSTLSRNIAKILQTCYFVYMGHV